MKITKTITIDLARAPDHPRILAVEGDSGSRAVQIRLKANLEPWAVPEGVEASLVYQKPDGTSGWYDTLPDGSAACAMEGNVIALELAPQVLTVEGTVSAALVLRDGAGNQITTFPFYIQVLSRPGDTETSRDYYNLKVVASIEELTARLEDLEKQGGGGVEPELIVDVTTTESVTQVLVNADINGEAFELIRYRVFVTFPPTGYDANSKYKLAPQTYGASIETKAMMEYERGCYLYTDAHAPREYATHYYTPVPVFSSDMGGNPTITAWTGTLTKFYVSAADETYPVPAGTRIRIWGERV